MLEGAKSKKGTTKRAGPSGNKMLSFPTTSD